MSGRFYLYMMDAVLFALCAGLWLADGFQKGETVTGLLGLVWLAGAGFWIVRAVREFRKRNGAAGGPSRDSQRLMRGDKK